MDELLDKPTEVDGVFVAIDENLGISMKPAITKTIKSI